MNSCVLPTLFSDINPGKTASFSLPLPKIKSQPPQLTEHTSVPPGFFLLFSLRNQE